MAEKLTEVEKLNLAEIKKLYKKESTKAGRDAVLYLCPAKLRPFLIQSK